MAANNQATGLTFHQHEVRKNKSQIFRLHLDDIKENNSIISEGVEDSARECSVQLGVRNFPRKGTNSTPRMSEVKFTERRQRRESLRSEKQVEVKMPFSSNSLPELSQRQNSESHPKSS